MKQLITGFLFFIPFFVDGQVFIQLLDKDSGAPISFATVKIYNTSLGAVSDSAGFFVLPQRPYDSLLISCIGYLQRTVYNGQISSNKVYLQSIENNLPDVAIRNLSVTSSLLIGETNSKADFYWGSSTRGDEFVQLVEFPSDLTYYRITSVSMPVRNLEGNTLLLFHIYAVDSSNNMPKEELLTDKYFFIGMSGASSKMATVDLRAANLIFQRNRIFVGFEWLPFKVSAHSRLLAVGMQKSAKASLTRSRTLTSSKYDWFQLEIKNTDNKFFYPKTLMSVTIDELK
ncbi:MAG: hypothetical protein JWN76_3579 [Chitinophagaceae bacterium]|nr:hypothetical protein [Chitinophagaceae bacterium]